MERQQLSQSVIRTILVACLVNLVAVAQPPRRGPPRGPIKGDRSQYFGKEGDYQSRQSAIPMPTVLIAICMAVFLVAIKMYVKPSPAAQAADKTK
mmetsp:Transcript_293/g.761  ORF Transcript_293/g.761 Transcript_293/m.761 type:complete len:95 (+) Transcript_293:47-331(+)|eukprot:CAMPEP_0197422388 /NCGR_PEP_ID=MMETSP1170-20131217/15463_1 /TAXON_ID=54406 /ORGANISM="Sarcinochrysis sp, Strain CCMP770" /LENGTH=94 /DNA_ID=CAMNT_0042949719 /DNA_START=47 /DNA_END=331 /DNA_ORIENTATION=+